MSLSVLFADMCSVCEPCELWLHSSHTLLCYLRVLLRPFHLY